LTWGLFLLLRQQQVLAQVTDALEQHTQPGDVVLARQQFLQHLDFVRQWRLADQSLMRGQIGMGRFFNFPDNSDAPSWRQAERNGSARRSLPA
jgi:hypothetical protein